LKVYLSLRKKQSQEINDTETDKTLPTEKNQKRESNKEIEFAEPRSCKA